MAHHTTSLAVLLSLEGSFEGLQKVIQSAEGPILPPRGGLLVLKALVADEMTHLKWLLKSAEILDQEEAMAPEPQSDPQPEGSEGAAVLQNEPVPEPQPETQDEPEPVPESQNEPEPEPQPELQNEPVPEPQPETQNEPEPEPQPEPHNEPVPKSESQEEGAIEQQPEPESQPKSTAAAQPEPQTEQPASAAEHPEPRKVSQPKRQAVPKEKKAPAKPTPKPGHRAGRTQAANATPSARRASSGARARASPPPKPKGTKHAAQLAKPIKQEDPVPEPQPEHLPTEEVKVETKVAEEAEEVKVEAKVVEVKPEQVNTKKKVAKRTNSKRRSTREAAKQPEKKEPEHDPVKSAMVPSNTDQPTLADHAKALPEEDTLVMSHDFQQRLYLFSATEEIKRVNVKLEESKALRVVTSNDTKDLFAAINAFRRQSDDIAMVDAASHLQECLSKYVQDITLEGHVYEEKCKKRKEDLIGAKKVLQQDREYHKEKERERRERERASSVPLQPARTDALTPVVASPHGRTPSPAAANELAPFTPPQRKHQRLAPIRSTLSPAPVHAQEQTSSPRKEQGMMQYPRLEGAFARLYRLPQKKEEVPPPMPMPVKPLTKKKPRLDPETQQRQIDRLYAEPTSKKKLAPLRIERARSQNARRSFVV